jgi:Protein of unknown function (DUF1566)
MKKLSFSVVAMIAFVAFAALALADPGTTWNQQINGQGRFEVLSQFGGAAVLDKETGRVWEQTPSTDADNWFNALHHCYNLEVGGRKGWRLPTIEELASLLDTSQTDPKLPAGHPFSNVQFSFYWSATTVAHNTSSAWGADFGTGGIGPGVKSGPDFLWCVR